MSHTQEPTVLNWFSIDLNWDQVLQLVLERITFLITLISTRLERGGKLKVAFFDLGDTLVRFKRQVLATWAEQLLSECHEDSITQDQIDMTVEQIKNSIRHEWAVRAEYDFSWVISDAAELEYWRGFYQSVLGRVRMHAPTSDLVELMACQAADPDSFERFPHVVDILNELRERGLRLGIISNAFPSAEKILWHFDLMRHFDYVILSYEKPSRCNEPFYKPFPAIYKTALHNARVDPEEALFIDDRPRFVKGAQKVGMRAIQFDPAKAQAVWEAVRRTAFVSTDAVESSPLHDRCSLSNAI